MKLYLIRHPEPLGAAGRCYGQLDLEAKIDGATVDAVRAQLAAAGLTGDCSTFPLWSSPLQRCRGLAEALHPAPRFDARLMEMNFGHWEGRPWKDISRDEIDAWATDVEGYAPPGGESAQALRHRLVSFLSERGEETLVLVTHAGVIRTVHSIATEEPVSAWLARPVVFAGVGWCEVKR